MVRAAVERSGTGGRARWSRGGREALALALLVLVPLLPYLVHLARRGDARFAVLGDFAALELATRRALHGAELLGPYSRFKFAHPGPLYFYLQAPLYALTGESSAALAFGASVIGALAATATVAAVRLAGTRLHGVIAAVVVLAWLAAFGNVTSTAWNPMVVVLPLLAYLALASLVAAGSTRAAVPAAFFGALAAETHLSAGPTVVACGVAALLAHFAGRRAGSRPSLRPFAIAALLVAVALVPVVVEQVRYGDDGNLARLARFFAHRQEPMKPLPVAVRNFFIALHWLPDRLFGLTLLEEGMIPRVMGWDPVPFVASPSVERIGAVHVAVVVLGGLAAGVSRDRASARLLAFGVLAELLAVASLRGSAGDDFHYLVFWTTAASTMAWIGGFAGLAGLAARRLRARSLPWGVVVAALGVLAALVAGLSASWTARNHPAWRKRPEFASIYAQLVRRLDERDATPIVHLAGAWNEAAGLVLELTKSHHATPIVERDRWFFGRSLPSADDADHPLHLVVVRPTEPAPETRCMAVLATAGELTLYGDVRDVKDVTDCPP